MSKKDKGVELETGESYGFALGVEDISSMMARREIPTLQKLGGVEGFGVGLKTNLKEGLPKEEAETEYADRKSVYAPKQ